MHFKKFIAHFAPAEGFCGVFPIHCTGHPYLYPGLFEYKNFRRFLEQAGFDIRRVEHWQWVRRETILPRALQQIPVLSGRIVAGGLRRLSRSRIELSEPTPRFAIGSGLLTA